MKTLAIDPGYERLGIAVIENLPGQKENLVFSECFKTSTKDDHSVRLSQIQLEIRKIIKDYEPNHLAIETLFFNKNVKTGILVAESRGTVLSEAVSNGLKVFEYSPQQIKVAVSGYGKSTKDAVMRMVPLLIKINKEIRHDDEMDAIAVGLTHTASHR